MSIISTTLGIVSADAERGQASSFSQKQAWYNEMDKARKQLVEDKQKQDLQSGISELNHQEHKDSVDSLQSVDSNNGSIAASSAQPVNEFTAAVSGISAAAVLQIANVGAAAATAANATILNSLRIALLPSPQNILQANLPRLESVMTNEMKLQNLQFLRNDDGVSVFFRDYRLDANELKKVVNRIKDALARLGIEVSEIIVNGNVFENQNDVKPEAI